MASYAPSTTAQHMSVACVLRHAMLQCSRVHPTTSRAAATQTTVAIRCAPAPLYSTDALMRVGVSQSTSLDSILQCVLMATAPRTSAAWQHVFRRATPPTSSARQSLSTARKLGWLHRKIGAVSTTASRAKSSVLIHGSEACQAAFSTRIPMSVTPPGTAHVPSITSAV